MFFFRWNSSTYQRLTANIILGKEVKAPLLSHNFAQGIYIKR